MNAKILKSVFKENPHPHISVAKYILDILYSLNPEKEIMIDCPSGRRRTVKEVIDHILNVAAAFVDKGLKKGDTVCFISPNNDYYAIGLIGVICAGGVFTACSDKCPFREVINAAEDTNALFLVSSPNNLQVAKEVADQLPQIKKIYVISEENIEANEKCESFMNLFNLDKSEINVTLPIEVDYYNDIGALLLSSGSTGRPKPIIRTHRNMINLTAQFQHEEIWKINETSVQACQNTFAHSGGITFLLHTLASGAIAAIIPGFEGEKFVTYIQKYRITNAFLVPSYVLYLANCNASNYDVSSLDGIFCAGSPLPSGIAERVITNMNLKYFHQGYGMTEVGFCTVVWRSKSFEQLHSVGSCVPAAEVKIIDRNTGVILGPHQIGEVLIKSTQTTPGYLNRPEDNAQLFDDEGFLKSGDAGYYDEDDLLYIVDRYKQIIKVEGVIVLPSELEAILLQHEAIAEAAVIGIKHDYYGEVPKGFVVLKHGYQHITSEIIIKYIDDLVTVFKKIRGGIVFLDEIPKTPLGKINKTLLK